MKNFLICFLAVTGCLHQEENSRMYPVETNEIMVVAHRGDWRNHPENSLEAIQGAIELGVEIVEIDIQETVDGHLILMHDETVDRTTNGQGAVSTLRLDEIKKLKLKNGLGRETRCTIPTLEEALNQSNGRVMVNLDKCYPYFKKAWNIVSQSPYSKSVIFKGSKDYNTVKEDLEAQLENINYMPVIFLDDSSGYHNFQSFNTNYKTWGYELIFSTDTSTILQQIPELRSAGRNMWVNALWGELCAGRDDDRALEKPDESWGTLINMGFNIIQTDRPAALEDYLKKRNETY